MHQNHSLCDQFGHILGSKATVSNGVCKASISRKLAVNILGRPAKSVASHEVIFESLDQHGKALCLGEFILLQNEIRSFTAKLVQHGLIISAIHNHWILEQPQILYLHTETIDFPLDFARKIKDSLSVVGP